MRTDGATESETPISRRGFVAAAGVHAVGAMVGVGGATAGSDDAVRIATTDPYRPGVEAVVADFERAENGRDVRLRSAGSDPSDRFRDRGLDVLVSGRPTLSVEDGAPTAVGRFVAVPDSAVLVRSNDRWRGCLRRGEVQSRWEGAAPVETWSESDWESAAAVARARESKRGWDGDSTTADRSILVRGTRSYQYARGFGGLGHYPVESSALDRTPDVESVRRDEAAPLVRLAYVHVDRDGVDGTVESFLRVYDRSRGDGSRDVEFFGDPAEEGGARAAPGARIPERSSPPKRPDSSGAR